jgi:hypothetical protein
MHASIKYSILSMAKKLYLAYVFNIIHDSKRLTCEFRYSLSFIYHPMQLTPDNVLAQYEAALTTRAVPASRHAEYRKWLRYYLDFRSKYPLPDSIGTGPCVHRAWLLGGLKRKEWTTSIYAQMPLESSLWHQCQNSLRMLKKAVQQGRSERRGEAYASVR